MTNIKHLSSRKIEIQLTSGNPPVEEKLERLISLACEYKAEHAYRQASNTLTIECKNDDDMTTLTQEIKNYLCKR